MGVLQPGSLIGRYRVLRALGAGAMGEVYLAEDPQIGRRVAVKTVRVEDGRAKELEERKLRLLREARAAGRLLHPNIVTLFDAGEDQGLLYLAFEFVEGTDLAHRLEEPPPVTLPEALRIVRQAAEALDYAHEQGVIHRDIKPSNLLLTADGRVKIADFGIARISDQTTDLTMTGSVVGSPHYLSPEQIRGEPLDGRTDVFSLGVMLYEMLAGKRPFDADTLTTLVYQILHKDPEPPDLGLLQAGPRLQELLRRMLQKDRSQRFASAGELAREVARLERELEAAGPQAPSMTQEMLDETYRLTDSAGATGAAAAASASQALSVRPVPTPAMASSPSLPESAPPLPPAATVRSGPSVGLWVSLGLGLVVLVGGGLAFLGWRWYQGWKAGIRSVLEMPPQISSEVPTPVPFPRLEPTPEPVPLPLEQPIALPEAATPGPPVFSSPPPVKPEPPGAVARPKLEPAATPELRKIEPQPMQRKPEPSVTEIQPTPRPVQVVKTPAVEEPTPEPEARPVAREQESREEDPDLDGIAIDRRLESGLALAFDVRPENAIIRVNRIVIGQAREWNPKKKGRVYDLPRPGRYLVRVIGEGKTFVVLVEARPGGPSPAWITVDFEGSASKRRKG